MRMDVLADRLDVLVGDEDRESFTLGEIAAAFREGGVGMTLAVLAIPAALPLPALFVAQIVGLPLVFLSVQLARGRESLLLPPFLLSWRIRRFVLSAAARGFRSWMTRTERIIRPRPPFLASGAPGRRFIGVCCTLCSLTILLPLPFSNTVPAIGVLITALGLLAQDGVVQLFGMVTGLFGVALAVGVYAFVFFTLIDDLASYGASV